MSSLGLGGYGLNPNLYGTTLNPYLYTGSSQLGLLSGSNSFANVLQRALYSMPVCECCSNCNQIQNNKIPSEVQNKKSENAGNYYKDYLQTYRSDLEQYRSSVRNSLIQSGKLSAKALSRYGQGGYTKQMLNSYKSKML